MSSFKTKKLPKTHTQHIPPKVQKHIQASEDWDTVESSSPPNRTRKWVGILLVIASVIFLGQLMLNAIAQYQIGWNIMESKLFKPFLLEGKEPPKGTVNILVAGIGGKDHAGWELTDSLMLIHANRETKSVTLLSLPRDLYVAYGANSAGKINALYPIGQGQGKGVNLLVEKVSEITNQPIHHYAVIDFSGFKSVVDALWGIEVDVPEDIYDREYPDENWGWEIFSLKKWLQTLDGATALKFVRSRHSTSDFDRSYRQQLVIHAIKEKALTLGILTNPTKIGDLINSVKSNLSTDMVVGDIVDLWITFKDIDASHIYSYSLNNDCIQTVCSPGSYLYQPSMAYFWGAWALIPEGAAMNRLSTYDRIRRFVDLVFAYPSLQSQSKSISIVTNNSNLTRARELRKGLSQLGFPIDTSKVIVQTGAVNGNTRIVVYRNDEADVGFTEDDIQIQALKRIAENVPVSFAKNNEFVKDQWPRIEIILGDDAKNYFDFSRSVSYLPTIQSPTTQTASTTTATQSTPSHSGTSSSTVPSLETEDNENIPVAPDTPPPPQETNTPQNIPSTTPELHLPTILPSETAENSHE